MAGLFLLSAQGGIDLTEKDEPIVPNLPETGCEPMPDHRRRRRLMAALAAAFLLGSFFTVGAGGVFLKLRENNRPISQQKLSEIQELIEGNYLFDVDEEAAANAAAAGYAGTLDQYSRYRNSEEYADFQAHNDGSLCGIGVTVAQYAEDSLYVLFLSDDSPADGIILPGDEIVAVEGERVADLGYTDTVSKIRGQEETSVSLTIRRDGEETEVSVMRADIVNDGIHALTIGNIGYVRVSAFNNATPEAFEKAVDSLQTDDSVTGLIFDLRGNGGGLLTSVAQMLDYLLPEGNLVSKTDKSGETTVLYTSDADCVSLPMIVLVNGSTASAAELFACDLQEYGAATIVGTTTFGKGVMQTTYSLSDGSALTLTTDYYNPSSGKNYNGIGVIPDIVCEMTEEEQKNFAFFDPDRDPQLRAALDALSG